MCNTLESIRKSLEQRVKKGGECTAEILVLAYGKVFKTPGRPKGFRLMMEKQCFRNSLILASAERGDYCEGFVARQGEYRIHHAWITRGDDTAIDVTLKDAENYFYLGIQFSHSAFLSLQTLGYGKHGLLMPPFDRDLLIRAIEASL